MYAYTVIGRRLIGTISTKRSLAASIPIDLRLKHALDIPDVVLDPNVHFRSCLAK
jgi:hypothetical protein